MNDTEITRLAYQLEILLPHVDVSYKNMLFFIEWIDLTYNYFKHTFLASVIYVLTTKQ